MEQSHRDQTECAASGGFLPANIHWPLTFYSRTTLSLLALLQGEMSYLCSGITDAGLGGDCKQFLISQLVFSFVYSQPRRTLCSHARRTMSGLCIWQAGFSLTVFERNVHSAIHPEPSQCINPWMPPGTSLWTAILDSQSWGMGPKLVGGGQPNHLKRMKMNLETYKSKIISIP